MDSVLPDTSLSATQQQLSLHTCNRCTHLLGNRKLVADEDSVSRWICGADINIHHTPDLVTGLRKYINLDIRDLRYNNCKGNWFLEYVQPAATYDRLPPVSTAKKSLGKLDLDDL